MMAFEYTNSLVYPFPEGMDTQNLEQIRAFADTMPLSALALVVMGWITGSFTAGWVTARLAKSHTFTLVLIVGGLLTIAGMVNAWMIQNPLWFHIGALPLFMICTYVGYIYCKRANVKVL
jgi:hypothetical protein